MGFASTEGAPPAEMRGAGPLATVVAGAAALVVPPGSNSDFNWFCSCFASVGGASGRAVARGGPHGKRLFGMAGARAFLEIGGGGGVGSSPAGHRGGRFGHGGEPGCFRTIGFAKCHQQVGERDLERLEAGAHLEGESFGLRHRLDRGDDTEEQRRQVLVRPAWNPQHGRDVERQILQDGAVADGGGNGIEVVDRRIGRKFRLDHHLDGLPRHERRSQRLTPGMVVRRCGICLEARAIGCGYGDVHRRRQHGETLGEGGACTGDTKPLMRPSGVLSAKLSRSGADLHCAQDGLYVPYTAEKWLT
jgi:hypothetical protein